MTAPDKTVLVTGATGLVGRHVCDHFRRSGWIVRGLARDTSRYPFLQPGIATFPADLPDFLDETAFDGVDVVVHCAWATRSGNPEAARRTNVEGTARVLELGRSCGVRHLVFVSSLAAARPEASDYGRQKLEAERLLGSRDLAVRPGLVLARGAGLYDRMSRIIRSLPVVPIVGADRSVPIIHIDDLCDAIEHLIEQEESGTVRLANEQEVTLGELVKATGQAFGRAPLLVPLPSAPVIAVLKFAERLGLSLPVSSDNVRGLLAQESATNDTAPPTPAVHLRSLEDSLSDLWS